MRFLILGFLVMSLITLKAPSLQANMRFLATADCQYENGNDSRKDRSNKTFETMFSIFDREPDIRGMLIAGDLTQNSRKDEFQWYQNGIASHGKFIYEGLGNHDVAKPDFGQRLACAFGLGACVFPKTISNTVFERKRETSFATSRQPHYSWDWEQVHFVQLNVFPANKPAPQFPEISPQKSLTFLADDLKSQVGDTNRPVVIVHHYGFDPFSKGQYGETWWTEDQRRQYWQVLSGYHVAAIITGHVHLPPSSFNWYIPWERPEGQTSGPDFIPTFVAGGGLKGAFIDVMIEDNRLLVRRYDNESDLQDEKVLDL
jgi:3',5'-cyclic AMP phosphodiesterase CpdA